MQLVPRTVELLVFGFLMEQFGEDAGVPAIELLFTAFGELQKGPSSPEFIVWTGTYGHHHWWIGVPASLPEDVTSVLTEYLSGPCSFNAPEFGEVPDMGLQPRWKYTPTVIYALAPISGGDDIDLSDYGTRLPVEALECMITDETEDDAE